MLTKLDGDARGGAALSVASVTGRPIMFASTGENLDDFEPFYPDRMASRILDLGDILTLIEQAQKAFDEEEARKVAEKFATDSFTLEDFLGQMQQLQEDGLASRRCSACCPAPGACASSSTTSTSARSCRTEAIIQSMTPAERQNPKLLNGSRRLRIARGSGMTVTDVNQLVQPLRAGREDDEDRRPRWHAADSGNGADARRVRRRRAARRAKKKSGSKSGNPAKRAAENAAIASGVKPAGIGAAGSGFGLGGLGGGAKDAAGGPSPEELESLQKFLGRYSGADNALVPIRVIG